jgi:acyl-CoA synthetase (AMP-forming)/AMP-acid ligase II
MRDSSLVDPLVERCRRDPDFVWIVVIDRHGQRHAITARQLLDASSRAAASLGTTGVGPGDLVVLALDHTPELLFALFGAFLRGAAVTLFPYPPLQTDDDAYRGRLGTFVENARARTVVTFDALATGEHPLGVRDCAVLGVDTLLTTLPLSETRLSSPRGEDIAVVQYTSGTTGLAKGVMIAHSALLASAVALGEHFGFTSEDTVVSWMPLFHDFGIVGGLALPVAHGARTVLVAPLRWARSPGLLFRLVHEFRGTTIFMTNSALRHSVDFVRDRELAELDLGSLRAIIVGAELAHHETLQLFVDRFGPYGLRDTAMADGYGMAENTLGAAITPAGSRPRVDWVVAADLYEKNRATPGEPGSSGVVAVVSCGVPLRDMKVAVVGADDEPLPERTLGRVLISSPTLFTGYRGRPDLTRAVLRDGWYTTGDVGYIADGQLYVCGRADDVIIVDGKNVYPQDVEACATRIDGLREGRAVAFGVYDARSGSERLVLVCELTRPCDQDARSAIEAAVRAKVVGEIGLAVGEVALVRKGWILRTPNGKLPRAANRAKYLAGLGETELSSDDGSN